MTSLQVGGPVSTVYLVLGLVFLVATVIDLLWTTLWVDGGAGPLSTRLTSTVWRSLRQVGSGHDRALSLAGPLILVLTLGMWVGLLWAGWTLVFAGSPNALLPARDGVPVTWTGRIYFVAYSMFTMGNGDFYPPGGIWQIAAALTTASGMLVVTLAVSYVISVLSAVSQKRSFASSVTGLGERSEEVVELGWNDGNFDGIHMPLDSLASQLDLLANQHKSFPILHYYHSIRPTHASAMGVAIFDETLTILRFGIPEADRPNPALVKNARAASHNYLETLDTAFIEPADEAPPPPDLDRLRAKGIPTVPDSEFEDALEGVADRRCSLYGIVLQDEWYWPPIDES